MGWLEVKKSIQTDKGMVEDEAGIQTEKGSRTSRSLTQIVYTVHNYYIGQEYLTTKLFLSASSDFTLLEEKTKY